MIKIYCIDKTWLKYILSENIVAITFMPWGIYLNKRVYEMSNENNINIIQHEKIHAAQQTELIYLFFYLWYGLEWLFRFIYYLFAYIPYRKLIRKTKQNYFSSSSYSAYLNISFELEAIANESDINYLTNRNRFDFIKFI